MATVRDITFEWLDDDKTWKTYDQKIQLDLVTSALKGYQKCQVKVPPRSSLVEVNFDRMTQTNVKTKWERLIRCCIKVRMLTKCVNDQCDLLINKDLR